MENSKVKSSTISIITPCFNEEDNILNCYKKTKAIFDDDLGNYIREHIFCDNNSSDKTFDILKKIASEDSDVKVIRNSKNFGILANNYNGILSSSGDAVLLMLPADLQDPPEMIPKMVDYWEKGYKIVYGLRSKREESFALVLMRKFYYRILSYISYVNYPADAGDFQLVDKIIIEKIKSIYTADPFIRMETFSFGFPQIGIPYTWKARKFGKSKNSFLSMLSQGITGLTSFSVLPIRLTIISGILISLFSLIYSLIILFISLFNYPPVSRGIPTVIIAIFFLGGIQLFTIGIIGEYVVKVLNQVRGRPNVVEAERINF